MPQLSWDIGDIFNPTAATAAFSASLGASADSWGGFALQLVGDAPNIVTSGNWSYAAATPWLGLGGSQGTTVYPPSLLTFYSAGSFDPTHYAWANFFDIILFGGGAAGSGYNFGSGGGVGGFAGASNGITLTPSQFSGALWTITIGGGGSPVGAANYPAPAGGPGGATSVVIPGYGTRTAAGGVGQQGSTGGASGAAGQSAASVTQAGQVYTGGAGGAAVGSGNGSPGNLPGGAGGGMGGGATQSGAGAQGVVYILVRQS